MTSDVLECIVIGSGSYPFPVMHSAFSYSHTSLDVTLTSFIMNRFQFRGAAVAPVGMIKQALWKIAGKC